MTAAQIIQYSEQALVLILLLSMPPIAVAAIVGTLVSLVQALTQVQEQTLGFVVKLVTVSITLLVTARWLGTELFSFALALFDTMPGLT
ncbi:type III secretion system export apparatus subunit SctS [Endozoicomonas sp. Mp262]|uniref:type III secretion system export apparatus subunit SctS n=1 Tax=Endozoicomonas sp. Mp262 TaxID=2919499 RepID=UPI0021DB09CA